MKKIFRKKKDWKDFEHEVYLKLKGYSDKDCFQLINKPILKHPIDKAPYRLPEFVLISDENNLIIILDCKKNYWQNIDLGSLNRLGWGIRGFLEKYEDYGLPSSSEFYFTHSVPKNLSTNDYLIIPCIVCTDADFEDYKKLITNLPKTEQNAEYTILNFKFFENFIKLNFQVPTSSSSTEIIKKRIKSGELTLGEYEEVLNNLKEFGPKHYLTTLNIKEKIVKGSDIELVLKYLLCNGTVSPIELRRFGKYVFKDNTSSGITVERFKENTKVYFPLGTKKTMEIILKLLDKKLIILHESHFLVWAMDGGLIFQPPGTKFKGKSLDGEVVPFIFHVTDKGRKLLEDLYGGRKKLRNSMFKDAAMGIGVGGQREK